MRPLILLPLLVGLSSATALSRPAAVEERVSGQVMLSRPVDGSPTNAQAPSSVHGGRAALLPHDTKSGSTRFSRRKRPRPKTDESGGGGFDIPPQPPKSQVVAKTEDEKDRSHHRQEPNRQRRLGEQQHQQPAAGADAEAGLENASARRVETEKHWRFTATRWRDDENDHDHRKPEATRSQESPPTRKPLSCFCSAGVICCRSKDDLGVGSTSCSYGMCGI